MTAEKYISLAKTTRATVICDLQELVSLVALQKSGNANILAIIRV
ncbi:hypothetical protein Bealeia1_00498 [Candidatus Bealeia paramacronuclearis]|uniref:Uncharacterized protein n=1 Tax=Candidatus Bealeia paramacronuclearis TaxID=1921001 RepID=A0ABZ2C256_9PROT|nr:hypothetical protein [Candidatus Bealeia paramacronuclearis]